MPHKNIVYLIKRMSVEMVSSGYTHEDVHEFIREEDLGELETLFDEFTDLSTTEKVRLCIQLEVDTQAQELADLQKLNREQIILMKVWATKAFLTTLAGGFLMLVGYVTLVNPSAANGKVKDLGDLIRVLFGF